MCVAPNAILHRPGVWPHQARMSGTSKEGEGVLADILTACAYQYDNDGAKAPEE
jgi:hypothetical protein